MPFTRQKTPAETGFAVRFESHGIIDGPGHVGRYLNDRGIQVLGMDLSGEMLEQAQKSNPPFGRFGADDDGLLLFQFFVDSMASSIC